MPRVRPGSRKLAVAYVRLSPRKGGAEDQLLGIAAQRAAIEAWAAREGVHVASWHVDDRVSGATPIDERPGLVTALSALRSERAGVLIVAKRDRIARDVVIAAMVERAARSMGSRLTSADGTGNGDEPADAFMRTVVDGAAAYERAVLRARTKAALAAKRAKNQRTGGIPFGSCIADDGVHLAPVASEQKTIATIRRLRTSGLSLRAVTEELEVLEISARSGRPFILNQVARILARAAG